MADRLVLYMRPACHLCHDMLAAAQPIAAAHGLDIETVDIDADLHLAKRYNIRIPVLELDGREICEHFLDADALEQTLANRGRARPDSRQ